MKKLTVLLLALCAGSSFAKGWNNAQLAQQPGMSSQRYQAVFRGNSAECKAKSSKLVFQYDQTHPSSLQLMGGGPNALANGGVGIGAATGAMAAQQQAERNQLAVDAYFGCMAEKGWLEEEK